MSNKTKQNKKIIIIGSGVAGMSAGIYAQLNGFDSQIIEMHSISGGMCTAWYRKGYKFDYSVQWLAGTKEGVFNKTYRETNILNDDVEILNADFHTKIVNPKGEDFILYTDIEKWRTYLKERAPEDEKAIDFLCKDIYRCSTLESLDLAPALRNPLHYIKNLLHSYPALYTVLKYKGVTAKKYFENLNLKSDWMRNSLLGLYGDEDFSIFAFLLIFGWYVKKNSGYPMGGSLELAKRMEEHYLKLGGKITFKKRVSEILVENNQAKGIKLTDDTIIESDYVISATDGHNTIFKLLQGKYVSSMVKKAYSKWEPFKSFVQVSLGINKRLTTEFPVQWVLVKDRKIGKTTVSTGYRILNYNFDPSMSPIEKTTIVIRFDSPWELWKDISNEDYKKEKEAIEQEAIRILEENYPGSSSYIEVCDVATPRSTVRYTGAWKGSYEGFLPSSKNITKQFDLTLPKLKNFYMIGQWLFPGGGIPPSVQSGKWALQMICKKEKQIFKVK
jgi:phytoene dehydrogenase-like protein